MAWFMIEASYTPAATKALISKPDDRTAAVRAMIEKAGGKLHNLFFTFGDCDVVVLAEFPDQESAMAVAMTSAAAGHLSSYKSRELFTGAAAVNAMKKASSMKLAVPG